MPLLYVFDFDQTIFRSPAPHPSLGDWAEFAQQSAVDGIGLGWFSEIATLLPPAVPLRPPADMYIESTLQLARQVASQRHCVIVLTGRPEAHQQRIAEILKSAPGGFPRYAMLRAKRFDTQGTVRFKASQISLFLNERWSQNMGGVDVPCEGIVLVDDRESQMARIAAEVRARCLGAEVKEMLVQAPPYHLPAALENQLMWQCLKNLRPKLADPRVFFVQRGKDDAAGRGGDDDESSKVGVEEVVVDPKEAILFTFRNHPQLLRQIQ